MLNFSKKTRYQRFPYQLDSEYVASQVASCSEEHCSPRTRIILVQYLLAIPSVINKRIDRSTGQTWTRWYTLMSQPSLRRCFNVERDDAEERALFHALLSIMQLSGNSMERQRYALGGSVLSWKIISANILMKIMGKFSRFP